MSGPRFDGLDDERLGAIAGSLLRDQAESVELGDADVSARVRAARRRAERPVGAGPLAGRAVRLAALAIVGMLVVAGLFGGGYFAARPTPTPMFPVPTPRPTPRTFAQANIYGAGLVDATSGWAVTVNGIFLTRDGGASWNRTEPGPAPAEIRRVFFLDRMHGWIASALPEGGAANVMRIDRTVDGGAHWIHGELTMRDPYGTYPGISFVSFSFVDASRGWMLVAAAAGTGARLSGSLFQSVDGGATWTPLQVPFGAAITFNSATDGWLAGGTQGRYLMETRDAGRTWAEIDIPLPADLHDWVEGYNDPVFFDATHAVIEVTAADLYSYVQKFENLFYTTDDAGRTWRLAARTGAAADAPSSFALSGTIVDARTWFSVTSDGRFLQTLTAGTAWREIHPVGLEGLTLTGLDFATPDVGWSIAVSSNGGCWEASGFTCTSGPGYLMATHDAGASWTAIPVGAK